VNGTPQYKIGPGDVLEIALPKGAPQEKVTATVKRTGTVTVPAGIPREPGRPPEAQYVPKEVTENETFLTVNGTPQYKIGPGDVLEIALPKGAPQEKVTATVKRTGTIEVAGVEVEVAGLTTEQAGGRLREALAPFYVRPQVEVAVKEYTSKTATVLGAVSRAGIFPLTGRTTLTELLLKAGGPTGNADQESVRITQPDGQVYTVNLTQLVLQGRLRQEPVLDAGSVVFLPEKAPEPRRVPVGEGIEVNVTGLTLEQAGGRLREALAPFYVRPQVEVAVKEYTSKTATVLGAVSRAGIFPLTGRTTLTELLLKAGGPTGNADQESVRITQPDGQVYTVNLTQLVLQGRLRQEPVLDAGSVVFLPEKAPEPRRVPVWEGIEVEVAGLTTEQAEGRLREALAPFYVRPQVEVTVKEYTSKKATVLGAVASRAGIFPLTGRTTLSDLLIKAGGPAANADLESVRVTQPDGQVYTVNLTQLVLQGRLRQEPVLDAGSVVFVPEKAPEAQRRVYILGEVRSPGGQPFTPNLTMTQALGQAGGATDLAVSSSARVIRGDLQKPTLIAADFDKVLKDGDLRFDVPLQSGDIIYVPRSPIGDWNAFMAKLQPTLGILSLGGGTAVTFKSLVTSP
jgi:protein involved in polysaccharide export with SLBB domain